MADMVDTSKAKIVEIQRGINDQVSGFKDHPVNYNPRLELAYDPFEWLKPQDRKFRMTLQEAFVMQPDAANLLRDGFKYIAFTTYKGIEPTYAQLVRKESSNRPEEQYLRDGAMGTVPRAPSGAEVKFVTSALEGGTKIQNFLYRMGVEVTGDDIKFDRLGKIRQMAYELGKSAIMTEESEFWTAATTGGNYTRNSTTLDNDIGANTLSTVFNATNLDTALTTISTAKDKKSGSYLGYNADSVWCGPRAEFAIKQFLMSDGLYRAGGWSGAAETRGGGTFNAYRGLLSKMVVSPWVNSYLWGLCDSSAYGYVWQTVEPWQILQENMNESSEAWLTRDAIRYVLRGYFGHGFVDDRAWFFSSTTSAPTVV